MQETVLSPSTETRTTHKIAVSLVIVLTIAFVAGGAWFAQFGR